MYPLFAHPNPHAFPSLSALHTDCVPRVLFLIGILKAMLGKGIFELKNVPKMQ